MSDRLNMIVAHSLSKRFGRALAVDSLDFTIPRGRVVGFLGPNGAGKTTTIRMIAGYLSPTSGWVEIDGEEVRPDRPAVRARVGYLPEASPLYTEMRVGDFLNFRARLFGVERSKRKRAIELVLRRCWLDDVRRRPIHQLSKGYRQRVGLAAALVHQPPVLILDEPTVGLDPAQIREMRTLIRELADRHTVLLSTHILPEVELTCDHVIMIARGRIRGQGTIDELRRDAAGLARYVVETDSGRAENALLQVAGVADVESLALDERWRRLTVTPKNGAADLREPLAAALCRLSGDGHQLKGVRELRREAPTLEHVFIQMIADAEAADDRVPAEQPLPRGRRGRRDRSGASPGGTA